MAISCLVLVSVPERLRVQPTPAAGRSDPALSLSGKERTVLEAMDLSCFLGHHSLLCKERGTELSVRFGRRTREGGGEEESADESLVEALRQGCIPASDPRFPQKITPVLARGAK